MEFTDATLITNDQTILLESIDQVEIMRHMINDIVGCVIIALVVLLSALYPEESPKDWSYYLVVNLMALSAINCFYNNYKVSITSNGCSFIVVKRLSKAKAEESKEIIGTAISRIAEEAK